MSLNGNYHDLMRLLDTVESTDYLRISELSYIWVNKDELVTMDRISISFEVTMIKDVDFSKTDAEAQQGSDETDEKLTLDYS